MQISFEDSLPSRTSQISKTIYVIPRLLRNSGGNRYSEQGSGKRSANYRRALVPDEYCTLYSARAGGYQWSGHHFYGHYKAFKGLERTKYPQRQGTVLRSFACRIMDWVCPLNIKNKVFKKNSRLSKNIPGTGMGLYVEKRMIEDNQGRIELESKVKVPALKSFLKTCLIWVKIYELASCSYEGLWNHAIHLLPSMYTLNLICYIYWRYHLYPLLRYKY